MSLNIPNVVVLSYLLCEPFPPTAFSTTVNLDLAAVKQSTRTNTQQAFGLSLVCITPKALSMGYFHFSHPYRNRALTSVLFRVSLHLECALLEHLRRVLNLLQELAPHEYVNQIEVIAVDAVKYAYYMPVSFVSSISIRDTDHYVPKIALLGIAILFAFPFSEWVSLIPD